MGGRKRAGNMQIAETNTRIVRHAMDGKLKTKKTSSFTKGHWGKAGKLLVASVGLVSNTRSARCHRASGSIRARCFANSVHTRGNPGARYARSGRALPRYFDDSMLRSNLILRSCKEKEDSSPILSVNILVYTCIRVHRQRVPHIDHLVG